jgi:uncharacterized repeat protein (TIGR01451 family)
MSRYYRYMRKNTNIGFIFTLLLLVSMLAPVLPAYAAPSLEITQTTDLTTNEVDTGTVFSYKFQYRCASTVENCLNVKVVDTIPADLEYVSMGTTTHIKETEFDSGTGKATWTFYEELPAGSTGEITLQVKFRDDGTCTPGTEAKNEVEISADNAGAVTGNDITVKATTSKDDDYEAIKTVDSGGFLFADASGNEVGSTVTYKVQACQPINSNQGGLNLTNITMVDTLPVSSTFFSASGTYSYTAATNSVTWNLPDLPVGSGRQCHDETVTVTFPAGDDFDKGDTVTNRVDVWGTPYGGSELQFSATKTDTLEGPQSGGGGLVKRVDPPYINSVGEVTYTIVPENSANGSNMPLQSAVVTDVIPAGLDVSTINTDISDSHPVTLSYSISASAPYTWTEVGTFTTNNSTTVASLGNPTITALKWDYGTMPLRFTGGSNTGFVATATAAKGTTITNTAVFTSPDLDTLQQYTVNLKVTDTKPRPNFSKSVLDGKSTTNGGIVTYRLSLTNGSYTGTSLDNPVVADLLSADMEYVDNSWEVTGATGIPTNTAIFEHIENYNGSGRELLRWSWTTTNTHQYSLPPNKNIDITFQAQVKQHADGGEISNSAALVGWDNPYIDLDEDGPGRCNGSPADTHDLDSDSNTSESTCSSGSSKVTVVKVVQLNSILEVKGELDSDWHRFPEYGRTLPGGTIEYRLQIENVGSVPVTNMRIVDILPFVGDTGVVDVMSRDSEWQPQFTELIKVPAGVTVYYSQEENPKRSELLQPDPPGSQYPQWSTVPPDDPTTVRSFRIKTGDNVLSPRDKMEIRWLMHAPVDVPDTLIAWDSFGYVTERTDTSTDLLPSEPIKVGVVVDRSATTAYGDYVWIDGDDDGIQDDGEPGVNLVRVELYTPGSDGTPNTSDDVLVDTTTTANNHGGEPGYYLFAGLAPGSYYARFYPPVGYEVVSANQGGDDEKDSDAFLDGSIYRTDVVTLTAGQEDLSWDMGLKEKTTAAVGNYVWFDRNGNDLQDEASSNGLNGITVELYDSSSNNLVSTTTTANDDNGNPGYYLFDNLTAGDYHLEFKLPTGASFTGQNQGGDDTIDSDVDASGKTADFTLDPGEYDRTWDAGIIMPTGPLSLGNRVWFDLDNDGNYEPGGDDGATPGVDGVVVNLYRDDGSTSGQYDTDDSFYATQTTYTRANEPGYYSFDELPAGDYIVQIDASNFSESGALYGWGSSTTTESDPNTDIDDDDNGDTSGDMVVSQAVTLSEDNEPITDRDDDKNTNMSVDFGFYQLARVGNYVWIDRNDDGIQNETADDGVNGVTVSLYDNSTNTLIDTTLTANDDDGNPGYYSFEGLQPGDYYLKFDLPAIAEDFAQKDQGGDTTDSDVDRNSDPNPGKTSGFTLTAGQEDLTWDAGLKLKSGSVSLGNLVWEDANNDGDVNGSESGISGVRVNLYTDSNNSASFDPGTDTFYASTTTDSTGHYTFTNLPDDNYIVQIDPVNFNEGKPLHHFGSSDPTESNPNTDIDDDDNGVPMLGYGVVTTQTVELASGNEPTNDGDTDADTNLSVDFGFYKLASLGDRVWVDSNWNGKQDSNEYGLPAVTVRLYDADTNTELDTTITNSTGYYTFTDLVPGNYYVKFIPSAGYAITTQNASSTDETNDSDAVADLKSADYGKTDTVSLGIDQHYPDLDAGVYSVVSLGNRVWFDIDNDGKYERGGDDGTNPGINDVTVSLYYDIDNDGTPDNGIDNGSGKPTEEGWTNPNVTSITTTTTITDTNGEPGYYIFENLREDNYIVQVDASNFANGQPLHRTESSTGAPDPDNDTDNDDNGKPGTTNGVVSKPVTLKSGYEPKEDGDSDNRTNLTVDFGFYPVVSLGDRVWLDLDNDGIYETGETGINGVTVKLYKDNNNDNTPNNWNNPIATTTTINDTNGEPGYYFFDNLEPGNYIVQIEASNFNSGKPLYNMVSSTSNGTDSTNRTDNANDDPDDNNDPDNDDNGWHHSNTARGVVSKAITLDYDQEPTTDDAGRNSINTTVDFGFFPLLSLGNFVWKDMKNTGAYNTGDGDNGIANVTLKLYYDNGTTTGEYDTGDTAVKDASNNDITTTTDATGHYTFTGLWPDNYIVQIEETNFASGNPLDGLASSTGDGPSNPAGADNSADPDNNNDTDDNGTRSPGVGVFSKPISLTLKSEPDTSDDGDDTDGNMTVDFGFYPLMSLGNLVWEDANNNGTQDAGETGIANVTVELYYGNETTALSTTTTDATGYYTFTNLVPTSYTLLITDTNFGSGSPLEGYFASNGLGTDTAGADTPADPDNNNDTDDNGDAYQPGRGVASQAIDLRLWDEPDIGTGNTDDDDNTNGNTTVDFGFFRTLSLGNRVWIDTNNNGTHEITETGIANVTVKLYHDKDNNDTINGSETTALSTTTTDATGHYLFDRLIEGKYRVELAADNFNSGQPLDGYVSSTGTNASASGDYEPAPDANIDTPAIDEDDNGTTTGTLGSGGSIISTLVTLELDTEPASETDLGNKGAGSAEDDNSNLTVDFGFFLPLSLGNHVWHDTNNNGTTDTDETGIDNVVVNLYKDSDSDGEADDWTTPLSTTTTSNGGYYLFTNLVPYTYVVQIDTNNFGSNNVLESYQSSSGSGDDPDADNNDDKDDNGQPHANNANGVVSGAVVLTEGGEPDTSDDGDNTNGNLTIDFGFHRLLTLGDLVWHDINNNATKDANEKGIDNVTVQLYYDVDNNNAYTPGTDTLSQTTITTGTGLYSFTNLLPGSYLVVITETNFISGSVLHYYKSSTANDVTPGVAPDADTNTTDSDDNGNIYQSGHGVASSAITLRDGDEPDGTLNTINWRLDFGLYEPGSVYGTVFHDLDGDKTQDTNEPGISNVTVTLYDNNGDLFATTTTADDGSYTFHQVPVGSYTVTETDPEGYNSTTPNTVSVDVPDNGSDQADFGDQQPGSLTGVVFDDLNNNGTQDPGEPGISNVTITLYDTNNNQVSTTTTANDGSYSFTNLIPGSYTVTETDPADYLSTTDNSKEDVKVPAGGSATVDFGDRRPDPTPTATPEPTATPTTMPEPQPQGIIDIDVKKNVALARVAPNQVVNYTISVTNSSTTDDIFSPVVVTDTLPAGLSYQAGSATIVEPAQDGQLLLWDDITRGEGLAPGESLHISFETTVTDTIGLYTNQVTVEAKYPGGSVTGHDDVSIVVEDPVVEVDKNIVTPGFVNGVITFTITLTNTGPSTMDVLPMVDHFFGPIEYIGGHPRADKIDNDAQIIGWNDLTEHLGNLEPGEVYHIDTVFRMTTDEEGVSVSNTVEVQDGKDIHNNTVSEQDDTETTTTKLPEPTAIELLSFTARRTNQGVIVRWNTGSEIDTWGFQVFRSTDNNRKNAVQVTSELITARGSRTAGASYSWVDSTAKGETRYTYWLQETELSGKLIDYGPATMPAATTNQSSNPIFLPMVMATHEGS